MKFSDETIALIYQEYLEIEHKAYQEKIRFFEYNKREITQLPFELRLEISIDYTVSLFEVGEYYQYLRHVDRLLSIVIKNNITTEGTDDVFQYLLFKKACALYNIVDYHAAHHHFSELVKISPSDTKFKMAFIKNNVNKRRYEDQRIRGFVIALFILSAIVIGIEILAVRPFYPDVVHHVEMTRNIIFLSGVSLAIFQELRIRFNAYRQYRRLTKNKRH